MEENFKLDINGRKSLSSRYLPLLLVGSYALLHSERNSLVNSATNMDKTREINDRDEQRD